VCVCVCVLYMVPSVLTTLPLRPKTPSSLASFKSRLVLPFWYRFTHVVLEKRPLNGCSVVVVPVFYILAFLLTTSYLPVIGQATATQVERLLSDSPGGSTGPGAKSDVYDHY